MDEIYFNLLFFAVSIFVSNAQTSVATNADSTINFKVLGACTQCKKRIQEAVKMKGVQTADWSVETKQLTLTYNPAFVTLDKIQNRILEVGHDLENRKAKDYIYNDLPACCHYREMETMLHDLSADSTNTGTNNSGNKVSSEYHLVKGLVLEEDSKGKFNPLVNASVYWVGTNVGVLTDSTGLFQVKHDGTKSRLVISYTGYSPDTVTVVDMKDLKIILASKKQLKEVLVSSTLRSSYINNISPIRTQTMSGGELLKAACCNLSEKL